MADTKGLRTPDGGWIGPEELRTLLADDGYSAGARADYLKELLTALSARTAEGEVSDPARARLVAEVRSILEDEQAEHGGEPLAKDTLG